MEGALGFGVCYGVGGGVGLVVEDVFFEGGMEIFVFGVVIQHFSILHGL